MNEDTIGIHLHQLKINKSGDWECKCCKRSALMLSSIPHAPDCKALIKSPPPEPGSAPIKHDSN